MLVLLIRGYQRLLSPLKPLPSCRYLPTCSAYAIEAVQRRGVLVGSALALWRILRCNPWAGWGYDPVPTRKLDPDALPGAARREDRSQ
jgi:hypothetical protein